ncbi:hypothetical protein HAX54_024932 [Datura stramonium]|uniref:Uncharacterized protein n=1 Tax=Datura stramonium TaxID=4076 RepID=A0ABS8V151_DATST|nr:hypothetical protein [Datura stramonium]
MLKRGMQSYRSQARLMFNGRPNIIEMRTMIDQTRDTNVLQIRGRKSAIFPSEACSIREPQMANRSRESTTNAMTVAFFNYYSTTTAAQNAQQGLRNQPPINRSAPPAEEPDLEQTGYAADKLVVINMDPDETEKHPVVAKEDVCEK